MTSDNMNYQYHIETKYGTTRTHSAGIDLRSWTPRRSWQRLLWWYPSFVENCPGIPVVLGAFALNGETILASTLIRIHVNQTDSKGKGIREEMLYLVWVREAARVFVDLVGWDIRSSIAQLVGPMCGVLGNSEMDGVHTTARSL
jgi:hypothetical protein